MSINLRNAMMSGGEKLPTAKDYVQDGLVAMWDGIENAGWGVHDANATTWTNLVSGGMNLTLGSYGEFSEDALLCLGGRSAAYGNESISAADAKNVTMVIDCGTSTSGIIAVFGQGVVNGAVEFVRTSNGLAVSTVLSASANLRNTITTEATRMSVSVNYQNNDVVSAYVNGELVTATYAFMSYNSFVFSVGDRQNDSSAPFTGKVHAIRCSSRNLTAAEIAANDAIDKARFGLP